MSIKFFYDGKFTHPEVGCTVSTYVPSSLKQPSTHSWSCSICTLTSVSLLVKNRYLTLDDIQEKSSLKCNNSTIK